MQGNAEPGKHVKDASHLADAAAWLAAYFVTCDRRILRKADQIASELDVRVVTPSELITIYDAAVAKDAPLLK
jgi:predicted nucleic acid-binding protein